MRVDLTSVMILLGLQMLAFSWRVIREVNGNERHSFPWVPVPDNVNVAAAATVFVWVVQAANAPSILQPAAS